LREITPHSIMVGAAKRGRGAKMSLISCRRQALAGIVAVAAGLIGPATASVAGAITEYATDADDLLQQGKTREARDAFDRAADAFWQAAPLDFRIVTFVDSVTAFGKYTPRDGADFRAGETAIVYLEPIGYGFASDEASFRVTLTTGLEIRTPGGLILAKSDDFGDLEWRGRTKSREIHVGVQVALPELKPGDYVLRLTLGDRASAKAATAVMPFSIVE
jgi:hypothetical protein